MKKVEELLEARQLELFKLMQEKQDALAKAPEGNLRVCNHNGKTRFYHRTNPKNFNGIYIRDENLDLARALAQKDYDKKILVDIGKELNIIDNFFEGMKDVDYEKIYNTFHKERQKLVNPIVLPDKEFVQKWESIEYCGKEFQEGTPEIYTLKGERVRSKSEMMIADTLNKLGIPYRYEYPMHLKGLGLIYPDFTILNMREREEKIWEHFGIMDSPEYADNAISKINNYVKNGINIGKQLIVTFETKNHPLTQMGIEKTIQQYLL